MNRCININEIFTIHTSSYTDESVY